MSAKKPGLAKYTDSSGFSPKGHSMPGGKATVTAAGGSSGDTAGKNYKLGSSKVTGKMAKGC